MFKHLENNPRITIVLIVLLMLCVNIDAIDVTIMEARNFITAREMITDGNWLLTTMNGEPRYQKPPLPTWLAAISGLIFGMKNLLALRFPGIVMIIVTGIYSYVLSNTILKNRVHSLINALITVTSFYVVGIIIEAPWDIFTHAFMLIAVFHLFHLFEKSKYYWQHTILAGVFIGLSFMCKGPISFYALLLPFLIAYGIVFKYRSFRAKIFSIFSILILASIVGGWWYLYIRFEDPETFLSIASKETANWSNYNTRPFYYYWSFFTQSGIWTIAAFISLLYPYLKTRVSNLKAYKFSLLWTILAVVLLSIIPEKKSRYLMPVLIPLAINIGFYIEYLFRAFKKLDNRKETFTVYFNFGLIAVIGIAFPFLGFILGSYLTGSMLFWFILASVLLFTIGVFIIIHLKRKNIKYVFYLCVAFITGAFITVLPLSKTQVQPGFKSVSNLKQEAEKENLKVYSLGYVSPEMIWAFGDKIPQIKVNDSTYHIPEADKFGVLTRNSSPMDFLDLKEKYTIIHRNTYDLNRSDPDKNKYKDRLVNYYYVLTKKK